uniref:Uncharacterized protein n=1 Tax=Anguilla anguilla TaxID=7936 RepID=A0A0E9QMY3_ANGAN
MYLRLKWEQLYLIIFG